MSELVKLNIQQHFATLTLNLEQKRNPLSAAMRQALIAELEALRGNEAVRCIILTGAGSAFCSGLDLDGLTAQSRFTAEENQADSLSIQSFFEYVYAFPKPTIAAVNGPAVAGGAGLALVCDVTLAGADAFFSFSEVKIGFVPALVSVYLERIAGPKFSRELLFTARRVNADEAKGMGLVNEVLPAEQLLARAGALAGEISQNSPSAVRLTKELLLRTRDLSAAQALKLAAELNASTRSTPECIEGVQAFFQKRKPGWVD